MLGGVTERRVGGYSIAPGRPRVPRPGVPSEIIEDLTPPPPPPPGPGGQGIDQSAVLHYVWEKLHWAEKIEQERARRGDDVVEEETTAFERGVRRWHAMGTYVVAAFTVAGALVSGGIAYQMWIGANATDAEVTKAIGEEIRRHNGGRLWSDIDPTTGQPFGDHPDMRAAIRANEVAVGKMTRALDETASTQRRLDLRSEYLFEHARWQVEVTEAERRGRSAPRKPERLEELERALMLGRE